LLEPGNKRDQTHQPCRPAQRTLRPNMRRPSRTEDSENAWPTSAVVAPRAKLPLLHARCTRISASSAEQRPDDRHKRHTVERKKHPSSCPSQPSTLPPSRSVTTRETAAAVGTRPMSRRAPPRDDWPKHLHNPRRVQRDMTAHLRRCNGAREPRCFAKNLERWKRWVFPLGVFGRRQCTPMNLVCPGGTRGTWCCSFRSCIFFA
jgi:hypothetical protein